MILKTSDLCDACPDALACALPLRSFGRRRSFAGTIRTIRCFEDVALLRDRVNEPGADQVLVVDGGGSLARALFGEVMGEMAVRNGWAGLVIHGAIRDCIEIGGMEIGVKALGTVPRRGERTGAGEMDVPVHFGGVSFIPGHRVVVDEDGVIVLPAGVKETSIQIADAVAATAAYVAPANRGEVVG